MKANIIKLAIAEAKKNNDESITKAQDMLLEHLITYPHDTDAWLLVTKLECAKSVEYADEIERFAEKILVYDPENPYALIFLTYAEYYMRGCSSDDLIYKLDKAKSDNPEILSMIELSKAFYWKHRDSKKYEAALKKSIEYFPYQRISYCLLGELYMRQQGKIIEGIKLIEKGLNYIKEVATGGDMDSPYDPTSIPDFLAEFFVGTITNIVSYLDLKNTISKYGNL